MSGAKRIKLENSARIQAILSDDLLELPPTTKFIAVKILNKKETKDLMTELNSKLPLNCINSVRRVHKDEILICSYDKIRKISDENELEKLRNFLISKNIQKSTIDNVTKENFRIVNIPDIAPKLKWQVVEMNEWPCKFHKNEYLESLYNNTTFNEFDLKRHHKYMRMCKYLSTELHNDNVAIAVNPHNWRVISFGFSQTQQNPIKHCAMDLIDQVAITQNGGVWSTEHDENYLKLSKKASEKFSIEFGEGEYEKSPTLGADNLHKFGPYLCTGYYIYFLNEPCLMCSMALVHARSKRIFYCRASANGSLGSITKLHTNKNLNHRYEVFHITDDNNVDDDDDESDKKDASCESKTLLI